MKARKLVGLAAISIVLAAPCVQAADPVRLDKAEVQTLLAGKTLRVEYVDPVQLELSGQGGFKSLLTASGIRGVGTWTVDDQGRLCLTSPSPLINGCRTIQRGDHGLGMSKPDGTGFFAISEIR
jgi:hypothetical protein